MNSNRRGFHVKAVFGNRRIADSRQVGGDDGELIRELRNERTPHMRRLCVSMQQNDVRSTSGQQVVELHPIYLSRARLDEVGSGVGFVHQRTPQLVQTIIGNEVYPNTRVLLIPVLRIAM